MHARRIGAGLRVRPGGPAWRVSARRRRERRNEGTGLSSSPGHAIRARKMARSLSEMTNVGTWPKNREDETGRLVAFDEGGRLVLVAPETVLRDFGLLLALI